MAFYRDASLIRNNPPPLGPPQGPELSLTVGSYEGAVSYERGTPVRGFGARGSCVVGAHVGAKDSHPAGCQGADSNASHSRVLTSR